MAEKMTDIDAIADQLRDVYKKRIMHTFPDGSGLLIAYYQHKDEYPENVIIVTISVWERFKTKYPQLAPKK